jgi:ABC-type multidrug transport system ATPase subunit
MQVSLEGIGKKFNRSWIFRGLNFSFLPGQSYAITGGNGSGKSTLLQLISGYLSPSEGQLKYTLRDKDLSPEHYFKHIAFTAPYMELPEEFKLSEMLAFHSRFKKPLLSLDEITDLTYLSSEKEKEIRLFSSGMKQRLKLALAIFFESDMILLDEPTSHLDAKGHQWYLDMIAKFKGDKSVIVSSNQPSEYVFCREEIRIEDFRPVPRR